MRFARSISAALVLCAPLRSVALDFDLPATTTGPGKLDLGVFNAGEVISLSITGQISLIAGWDVYADGSLVQPLSRPEFDYGNVGAGGYPTDFGGDGTNHFINGGANYDAVLGGIDGFGLTGAQTTDTTAPGVIRFGSVVATFAATPAREDWFFVGISKTIVIPTNDTHLYVAVHDTTYANDSGSFNGKLTFVEPALLKIRTYAGLEIEGTVGQNYRIDYTATLPPVNWTGLTNILLPSSPYLFLDLSGPAAGQRYYRAVATP